jgi:cell division protein FtsB
VEQLKADLLQSEHERAKAKSDRHKAESRADRLKEENEILKAQVNLMEAQYRRKTNYPHDGSDLINIGCSNMRIVTDENGFVIKYERNP